MLNELHLKMYVALLGDKNCIEWRDKSHQCYKSIINYDLDLLRNSLVFSPQIHYIKVFDINPLFNKQIWLVPRDFVQSRFHCIAVPLFRVNFSHLH